MAKIVIRVTGFIELADEIIERKVTERPDGFYATISGQKVRVEPQDDGSYLYHDIVPTPPLMKPLPDFANSEGVINKALAGLGFDFNFADMVARHAPKGDN